MRIGRYALIGAILLFALSLRGCLRKADQSETVPEIPVQRDPGDIITLHYHERPPYTFTTDEGVKGLLIEPVEEAFRKSGIPYVWSKTPSNRQLKIIQDNRGRDGILGWFRNSEREEFGQFSYFIYQDSPYIAICRADNAKIGESVSIEGLLSDDDLVLAVKSGYSYGFFLDDQIKRFDTATDTVTTENLQILQKIHLGRGDYFFIAPEEADILIEESGLPRSDFRYVTFSEMPYGEKRYIIFSLKVEPEEVKRISEEIAIIIGP